MSVMLAKNWAGSDPAGWWMSEKLDGVRAVWDGYTLATRAGNEINAPASFVSSLPRGVGLDGELWAGRGTFQSVVGAYRRLDAESWRPIRYAVFDAPAAAGGFEERQRVLAAVLAGSHGPAFVVAQRQCVGRSDLNAMLASIVRGGGEGVMLREPGSAYQPKRSASLLKVKRVHDDEATVIGYEPGTGRNRSTIGSLVAQLADGTVFNISSGLSDAARMKPPAIGTRVTFSHHDYTDAGVPRFPSFIRTA
jgi:DNA ligase-1